MNAVSHAFADVGRLIVRRRRHADLGDGDRARWAALSRQAGGANVFATDWMMDAAIRHCDADCMVVLAVVEHEDGGWIGVLPVTREPRFGRWPIPNIESWNAANQFLGVPLVAPGWEDAFWRALLADCDARPERAYALLCNGLAMDDPAGAALIDLCAREGRALKLSRILDRPARGIGFEQPAAPATRKLRARLAGLERRLARDVGPVTVALHPSDRSATPWLDAFLSLERTGWKGRSGSALACDRATERFFREIVVHAHRAGTIRLATLSAGNRILAMTSWFVVGACGFGFKMAFAEDHRAYAPGLLLSRHVADGLGGDDVRLFDTCVPGDATTSLHRLWPGRRTIFDCAVAIGPPARRAAFALAMRGMTACRVVRARVTRPIARYGVPVATVAFGATAELALAMS